MTPVPVAALGASALFLGFLHGLGLDHLMAIAALSIDGRPASPNTRYARGYAGVRTAMQFACGHTLMLGVGLFLALTFGWIMPAAIESGAERAGGLLLVLLGGAGCWTTMSGRAYGHMHAEIGAGLRWHFHFGPKGEHPAAGHRHSAMPTAMGALFAISSLRALVMLAPMGTSLAALSLPVLLVLVLLFGVGILLSMSLFGVVLAGLLSLRGLETLGRAAGLLVGAASIGLGVYWMFS
jgi:hypothetical protein